MADADGANRARILSLAAAHHVAGLVAGRRVAGLRVVRAARLGGVRAASAHRQRRPWSRRAPASTARRRCSPDGKKLALTLSGSNGNLDIYLLDLATQQLTRLTDDPGIDTEAVVHARWQRRLLHLGSLRQLRRYTALTLGSSERPKRVTFTGRYNARPRVSPDGKQLAMLTLDDGAYRIGHAGSGQRHACTVLSKGRQEESPSFAPNGAMLIFAGRERGQGVLQTVSIDGQTSARLDADAGEVREPVWGPFLP